MQLRTGAILAITAAAFLAVPSWAFSQDKFHLKAGAKGMVCLGCHVALQDTMKLPFVHTPLKTGDCASCHNPHASSYGKLLAGNPNRICLSCHDDILPKKSRSAHKVATEGKCVACHDPHAAKYKGNLRLAGNDLCFSCHKEVANDIAGNRFKHSPVEKGCLNCHNPHASAEADSLLVTLIPDLCTNCHKADKPSFAGKHMGYPVAKGSCSSCHDPHGSSNRGILLKEVHRPVANRMCNQCHKDPSSPEALGTNKSGFELCGGCHSNMLNETFGRNRLHWPVVDKVSCLNCHAPHASKTGSLLKSSNIPLCGTCHGDTIQRQEKSLTKHPPVKEGECTKCHMPHSSNNVFLLENTTTINLCGTCHDWQKHSSHPIGGKVIDRRNRNLVMDCLSCHRSHGTEFKYFAHYDTKMDLCVQCHEQYKR